MSLNIFKDDHKPYWKLLPIVVVLVFFLFWMNSYMPPADLAPEGYSSVILAFEFAQTRTEISEVMIPLSASQMANLDQVQKIDFGFMLAYSSLLFGFFWISKKLSNRRHLIGGMVLSLVALIGDFFENIQLLDLTQMFMTNAPVPEFESVLSNLSVFTWLKWASLALSFGLLVPYLWKKGLLSKVIAILLAVAPIMLVVAAVVGTRPVIDKFGTSIFLGFFAIAIYIIAYRKPQLA